MYSVSFIQDVSVSFYDEDGAKPPKLLKMPEKQLFWTALRLCSNFIDILKINRIYGGVQAKMKKSA